MLVVGLLYGANYSVIKLVTPEHLEAFGFIVVRVLVAAALFWALAWKSEPIDWKTDGWRLFLCALFGVGINMLCFFKGVSLTSAINASIIMTLTPAMVFIMSIILLKEKVIKRRILGLLIGFVGAFLIVYQPDAASQTGDWRGDLLVILNAATYGTYLVLVKPLMNKYTPLTVAKWVFLFGIPVVLPVGWGEFATISWAALDANVYWSMAYVIIGVTVIVYVLNIWAMKKVSPSTVGAYIYVQPIFATLIASVAFGEALTLRHLVAAVLVFIGVGLVIQKR